MSTLNDFLTGIANAIRAKTGTSAAIPAQNFAAEIAAIQTGYDTADATGGAGQMLSPYTAYGPNGKFTGSIPSQNATTITPGTSVKTAIPAGTYAAGAATVAGDANLVAGNIKEGVSIFGVTGSFAGGGGYPELVFNKVLGTPSGARPPIPYSFTISIPENINYVILSYADTNIGVAKWNGSSWSIVLGAFYSISSGGSKTSIGIMSSGGQSELFYCLLSGISGVSI